MNGPEDSMAWRKVVSLPSPYSRLRGVPPLGEVRNESQSKSAKKKFREVHYINFISR